MWCDSGSLAALESTHTGRMKIAGCIKAYKQKDETVFARAWGKLSPDFKWNPLEHKGMLENDLAIEYCAKDHTAGGLAPHHERVIIQAGQ